MWSTSCEMLGWMNHKLESRLSGEISIISDTHMTSLYITLSWMEPMLTEKNINKLKYAEDITLVAEIEEELKNLFMKLKEESEKPSLKLNIQKMKIIASGPVTSWQIHGETMKQ